MNDARTQQLKIWQQNTRKSSEAQFMTLHAVQPDTDFICIQEPYIDFQGRTRATPGWYTIYPTKHKFTNDIKTRSVILINKKISTNTWTQIDVDSLDITAIQIRSERGTINLYNIYNDGTH
ncbi:hypothetical protein BJ912DRAFT_848521, partial [Pholiota molesta]